MRRRIFLIALICMVCTSCKEKERTGFTFLRSYVNTYKDAPWVVKEAPVAVPINKYLILKLDRGGEVYISPEWWNPFPKESEIERFLEIAERNGDRFYDRDVLQENCDQTCCADNFKEIRVVCLNQAWDATHPAGSLLNDLLEISFLSYAEYVRSGYKGKGMVGGPKPMTELLETDLMMIEPRLDLDFDKLPVAGSYEIKVTMITTENIEKVATCTFVVE